MKDHTRGTNRSLLSIMRDRLALEISDKLLSTQETVYWTSIRYQRLTSAFILGALPAERYRELTDRRYARQRRLDKPGGVSGLADWEQKLVSYLPKPPAKVLLGGCGDGREARALAAMRYHVTAFDPIARFIERARTMQTRNVAYLVGSYEDLVAPNGAASNEFCRELHVRAPFDAVYLGWGSFSHVPLETTRIGLLKKLRHLNPTGPIALSFLPGLQQDAKPAQIHNLVIAVAAWIFGRTGPMVSHSDHIFFRGGFVHGFTEHELANLARQAGFQISTQLEDTRTKYRGVVLNPLN